MIKFFKKFLKKKGVKEKPFNIYDHYTKEEVVELLNGILHGDVAVYIKPGSQYFSLMNGVFFGSIWIRGVQKAILNYNKFDGKMVIDLRSNK